MSFVRKIKFGEPQLIAGFILLLILMVLIGLAGIWRIQSLSTIIEELGRRSLVIEKLVLEMKISNTLYATAVRNFALWQTTKYLGAASGASNLDSIHKNIEEFNRQLASTAKYVYQPLQKQALERLANFVKDLRGLGEQIISLAKAGAKAAEINNLLLVFENSFYKINEFLDDNLTMTNLKEIDGQIRLGYTQKDEAIFLLTWVLILGLVIGTGTSAWVYYRRKAERQKKAEMVRQIITLEERERQNLSAQIHDQMAQDLSGLKIYTGVIEQALAGHAQNKELNNNLEQMKKILSGLIEKTHNICLLLRPPQLDELGLAESIEALILEYKQLTGINYIYEKPADDLRLEPESSLFLYRLTQEALTNSAKYAQAKNVKISLSQNKNGVEFSYEDDGIGFEPHKVINQPRRRREDKLKLGLLGLKERVELLGGVMQIDSAVGRGTRILVSLS